MAFDINTAAEIALSPYLAREELREDVRRRHYGADAARSSGVHFGGTEAQSFKMRSDEQVRADAKAAFLASQVFAESPRGRFLKALRELQDLGYGAEAEAARAAFARGFASADRPACPSEVGFAISKLAGINHPDARIAILALGQLLASEQKAAA